MKNIPTKWEWIRDACKNLGYHEAAKIADKIDECVKKSYPGERMITCAWISACLDHQLYRDEPDVVEIMVVATNALYCAPCEYTESGNCNDCKFQINGGVVLYEIFKHYLRAMK